MFFFTGTGIQEVIFEDKESSYRTYGDIKNAVGEHLKIQEKSRTIFGIFRIFDFKLDFYPPKELCKDTDALPAEIVKLGFFRLSFDAEQEWSIMREDIGALMYIYWEVSFLQHKGAYIKDPQGTIMEYNKLYSAWHSVNEQNHERKQFLKDVLEGKLCIGRMKIIPHCEEEIQKILYSHETIGVEALLNSSDAQKDATVELIYVYLWQMHAQQFYYWSYYYKAEGVLCGENAPLLASCFNLNEQFSIIVTVSKTCLGFLGETTSGSFIHLFDFPWCNIQYIARKCNIFSFQILVNDFKGNQQFITVNVFTHLCAFLYSLSAYVLGEQTKIVQSCASSRERSLSDILKLLQSCVPSSKKSLTYGSLNCLLPNSLPAYPPRISGYGFCGEDGYLLNDCYIPMPIDLMSLYVRNVKGIPAGPGEYVDGKPIYLSYLSHEEELVKQLSPEKQRKAREILSAKVNISWELKYDLSRKEKQALMDEVDEGLKPTIFGSKIITVHAFWRGPFWVPAAKYTSVKSLKKYVVHTLNMRESSLKVFGLFVCFDDCPLDYSIKLCTDDEPLPGSLHFCFRRLSFGRNLEAKVIEHDTRAHKLLWSEAKYMYDKDAILPPLSEKSKRYLNTSFRIGSLRQHFVELLMEVPRFWWDYYYRADSSPESFTSDKLSDNVPSHVAITDECFYLLDKYALNSKKVAIEHVLSIRTESAESMPLVTLPKTPRILVIDILVKRKRREEQEAEYMLETVTIHTAHHELLLSVARVAFALRKNVQETRQEYISEKFSNNFLFQGPSYSVLKPSEDTIRVINPCFTGLSRKPKRKVHHRK